MTLEAVDITRSGKQVIPEDADLVLLARPSAEGEERYLASRVDDFMAAVAASGNPTRLLTAVPDDAVGVDGDTALVRLSSITVRAYLKVAGSWARQWTFNGGDSVFLTGSLAAIDDRVPATATDATTFLRRYGISGYSPVTEDDIDQSMGAVGSPSDLRGGNHGNVGS